MYKGKVLFFLLGFLLTYNLNVLADEGSHEHEESIKKAAENFRNGDTKQEEDHHSEDRSENDQEEADHHDETGGHGDGGSSENDTHEGSENDESNHQEDANSHNDSGANEESEGQTDNSGHGDSEGHDDSGAHDESEGHGEAAVQEPGPDYKVLGAFGAVNFTFIIIGIWNKWFRRKGE